MTWRQYGWCGGLALFSLVLSARAAEPTHLLYEIGGPLAGLRLPLRPTEHGEPAGYPGAVPSSGQPDQPSYPPVGEPEVQLYPGSVERYHTYWHKYCPVRSFFDLQSQVKNFVAPKIPGVRPQQVETYAAPVYWVPANDDPQNVGKRLKPVPVVRCKTGDPVLQLDLGELPVGLYCVRLIGAVPTEKLRTFLWPVLVRMTVNDGPDGQVSTYRIRIGYQDEFYSVAELYFHAPQQRTYRAEVTLDEGTQTDLLVHNVSVDDVLAGCQRRAVKQRQTMQSPRQTALLEKSWPIIQWQRDRQADERSKKPRPQPTAEDRLARDARIWLALPHPNQQGAETRNSPGEQPYRAKLLSGQPGVSPEQFEAQHGAWTAALAAAGHNVRRSIDQADVLLANAKLGLKYTVEDLAAGRALPDPFPLKDRGQGVYFPDPKDPAAGHAYWPVARAAEQRLDWLLAIASEGSTVWLVTKDSQAARDAAVALARFAYQFPTLDPARCLRVVTTHSWFRQRTLFRRRVAEQMVYGNFIRFNEPLDYYDRLFDYVRGNQELAASIGRFVPWVKTPEDVIQLFDVYLVQTMAKRVLRYQWYGDGRQPSRIAEIAVVLADNRVTDPWMEWLFSRTFFYPSPLAGIQDLMISNTDRDGRSPIGSRSYTLGDFSAGHIAATLDSYLAAGGNPKFDLRDLNRYPKTLVSTWFWLHQWTAGLYFPRIGTVTGPDKRYAHHFHGDTFDVQQGWLWTKDPRFAWVLKHFGRREAFDDRQWQEIEQAATHVKRAPWLDLPSRVLPGWAAILESGRQHDDPRFRRSLLVRVGVGHGHSHHDSLDLQLHAHGLPMTIDGGQRGGYSEPGDHHTRVHNTVEVDGQNHNAHCWARSLCDAPGAQCLTAEGVPPDGARLWRRQVALIDVDEGKGSQPLSPQQTGPEPENLPRDVVTPNSYVFDVFRVRGGSRHTYCFHATTDTAVSINAVDRIAGGKADQDAREYLGLFGDAPEKKFVGTAPEVLEATWPMLCERIGRASGSEPFLMGKMFDPQSPRKFTRLSMFDLAGARTLEADLVCTQWGYRINCLMVQRRGSGDFASVFPAVIEPYAGEPLVVGKRALAIEDNDQDALRAVAVEIKTRAGNTDVCFFDGRPEKRRRAGPLTVSGQFAYHSIDAQGLRQATLSGGTLLEAPTVRIAAAAAERSGKIVAADYFGKTIRIDQVWPASRRPHLVEIGAMPAEFDGAYTTSYTATAVDPEKEGSTLRFFHGSDLFRSRILRVDQSKATVTCALDSPRPLQGVRRGPVASNEQLTKFWRVASISDQVVELDGGPVLAADFAPDNALRLWEYGVGDRVRQTTCVSLRRLEQEVYEVTADVPASLSLQARQVQVSRDGKTWTALRGNSANGWFTLELQPGDAPVRLKIL